MREWIRFKEHRAKRYHALAAEGATSGRMVTVCGRSYDFLDAVDSTTIPPFRCAACQRRLEHTRYLIPQGTELETLVNGGRQMKLLEVRQRILALEAKRLRKVIGKATRNNEAPTESQRKERA